MTFSILTPGEYGIVIRSVASDDMSVILLKAMTWKVHFGMQVHLRNIYVKFLYQGRRVKVNVKVRGAKSVSVSCSRVVWH